MKDVPDEFLGIAKMVRKAKLYPPRPAIPNPEPEACPKASGEGSAPLLHRDQLNQNNVSTREDYSWLKNAK